MPGPRGARAGLLPLDLGGPRGRGLAGARTSCIAQPARRDLPRRRVAASPARRRSRCWSPTRPAPASARRGRAARRRRRPARRSCSAGIAADGANAAARRDRRDRADPRADRAAAARGRRRRCRRRSYDARRRRLLRGVVDPDHQGAADLRRGAGDPAARDRLRAQAARAASRTATGRTASAPSGCCSR